MMTTLSAKRHLNLQHVKRVFLMRELESFERYGSLGRDRTADLMINSYKISVSIHSYIFPNNHICHIKQGLSIL